MQRTCFLLKPKKRAKSGAPFIKASQTWRDNWQVQQVKKLARSSKAYVDFCSTKRIVPWDSRFRPFDRSPKDGIYFVMKHFMDDKLNAANYHAKPTRKLFCNVGLLGPRFGSSVVPHSAHWKPKQYTRLPHDAKLLNELKNQQKGVTASYYTF